VLLICHRIFAVIPWRRGDRVVVSFMDRFRFRDIGRILGADDESEIRARIVIGR